VLALILEGGLPDRNPIRETFFGCCAWADEQNAKSMAHKLEVRSPKAKIGFRFLTADL
jgi:hypothetical protein